MTGRLDHVALQVRDFDDRVAALQRLGMTVRRFGVLSSDPSRRIAMLADSRGFKLELVESGDDGFAHLAFEVESVADAIDGTGLTVDRPPYRLEAARADSAMLSDPGGLTVQLVRYDPDSPDR
ncbi:hypothetical protein BH11ACT7_BH11ACT7_35950 [soil metagenome]